MMIAVIGGTEGTADCINRDVLATATALHDDTGYVVMTVGHVQDMYFSRTSDGLDIDIAEMQRMIEDFKKVRIDDYAVSTVLDVRDYHDYMVKLLLLYTWISFVLFHRRSSRGLRTFQNIRRQ